MIKKTNLICIICFCCFSTLSCSNEKKEKAAKEIFNSIGFKNHSGETIWVESLSGIDGGERCGFLISKAESVTSGLQLSKVDAKVIIEWWSGEKRDRPLDPKKIYLSSIKVQADMKDGDVLWLEFQPSGKWTYSVMHE